MAATVPRHAGPRAVSATGNWSVRPKWHSVYEVNLLRRAPGQEVRRRVPARDEAGPAYVVTQQPGCIPATVGRSGTPIACLHGCQEFGRCIDSEARGGKTLRITCHDPLGPGMSSRLV